MLSIKVCLNIEGVRRKKPVVQDLANISQAHIYIYENIIALSLRKYNCCKGLLYKNTLAIAERSIISLLTSC